MTTAPDAPTSLDVLRARLRELAPVLVAFSGGADSAFLAWVAHDTLGPDAHAVTAVSPSLAPEEELDCGALA
ncbi:MAG: TIGR00268 family protein, partial [Acidimicrobiales bacterium]